MFLRESAYGEQLARWGIDELPGALAFPAQIGPPPSVPKWRRVAGGSTTSCYRLEPDADERSDGAVALYLKHYRYNPPSVRYLFRCSRAKQEAANLRRLGELGIHCPRIVAVGEQRETGPLLAIGPVVGGIVAGIGAIALVAAVIVWAFSFLEVAREAGWVEWAIKLALFGGGTLAAGLAIAVVCAIASALLTAAGRSYLVGASLITTAIEPSQDLWAFARHRWTSPYAGDPVHRQQIRRLGRQLAAQVAVLHARGFVHRDLKFRNLLVCWPKGQQPGPTNLRLAWIDCPRGVRMTPGPWRTHWIVNDLADLDRNAAPYVSRTQRLRFLKSYLRACGGERGLRKLRPLARKVLARHAIRAAR